MVTTVEDDTDHDGVQEDAMVLPQQPLIVTSHYIYIYIL